jgi:phage-related protein
MTRKTRPVSWLKAALKEFEKFPEGARTICLAALTIAAEGEMSDIAKPLRGLGSGVSRSPCRSVAMLSVWCMRCRSAKKYG